MKKTVLTILSEAEETLYTASLGLQQLIQAKNPKERIAGLRNVIVFGRAVTNVLQNLRGITGKVFDEWYQPKVEEMKQDKILQHLYVLRSQILKQGTLKTSSSITLTGDPSALMRQYTPPPRAKGFFIGDTLGGCGWEIEVEEGIIEKYYVNVPENIPGLDLSIRVHLFNAPEDCRDMDIQKIAQYYIEYMNKLLCEAKNIFCKSA